MGIAADQTADGAIDKAPRDGDGGVGSVRSIGHLGHDRLDRAYQMLEHVETVAPRLDEVGVGMAVGARAEAPPRKDRIAHSPLGECFSRHPNRRRPAMIDSQHADERLPEEVVVTVADAAEKPICCETSIFATSGV